MTVIKKYSCSVDACPVRSWLDVDIVVLQFVKYFESQVLSLVRGVHTGNGTESNKTLVSLENDPCKVSSKTASTLVSDVFAEGTHKIVADMTYTCRLKSKPTLSC